MVRRFAGMNGRCRLVLGCGVLLLGVILFRFWYYPPQVVFVPPTNFSSKSSSDTSFWTSRDAVMGLGPPAISTDTSSQVCNGFFGVWPSDCTYKIEELDERIRLISSQMVVMNSSFTLYVTGMKKCHFPYHGISVRLFNTTEVLLKSGFTFKSLEIMNTWKKTRYTRISDILRICIAYEFQQSYLDSDVHFLRLEGGLYQRPYVGAALWSDNKNAIEITNAAFCLPRNVLRDFLDYLVYRVTFGSSEYFYTELGPSMFHKVLETLHFSLFVT